MKTKLDILFLVDTGIGNAIEVLYAVEYCLRNGKKAGLFLGNVSRAFSAYLRDSYGDTVIVGDLSTVSATNLVHSWLYEGDITATFDFYFFVEANRQSTTYLSESEQYLSIAKALYPSSLDITDLIFLKEDYSERARQVEVERKCVLYPGCDSRTPSKRWPYFNALVAELGPDNVAMVGGADDLNAKYSYYYPSWVTWFFPPFLLRKLAVFRTLKSLKLLARHAHPNGWEQAPFSYFNVFSWPELTALFRRAGSFVGNDGGLSQLAAACGAPGLVIFGPSSLSKNRPYSRKFRAVSTSLTLSCQPCQFRVNGVDSMSKNSILCPRQVRCLYSINAQSISAAVRAIRSTASPTDTVQSEGSSSQSILLRASP